MSERYRLEPNNIPADVLARPLVFDTNVWLFINGPFIDLKDQRHRVYSSLYAAALKAGTQIWLPQIVLSEFVRQCLRQYATSSEGELPRKLHSHSDYQAWMTDISDEVFHIVEACKLLADDFDKFDLDACFGEAGSGGIDFNDVMLSELCRRHNFLLVTDDADFSASTLAIASSNRKLLAV